MREHFSPEQTHTSEDSTSEAAAQAKQQQTHTQNARAKGKKRGAKAALTARQLSNQE